MKNPATVGILACMVLGLSLSGCVKLRRAQPEKHFFLVAPSRDNSPPEAAAVRRGTLGVQRFTISPTCESPSFVYRTGESEYQNDYYNAFFIPPDAMLTETCTRWLANSGRFQRVSALSEQVHWDYVLQANVSSIYGDYRVDRSPEAVIEIQFLLTREVDREPEVVLQKNYVAREKIEGHTADALVSAWNRGLSSMLAGFESDLASAVDAQNPPAAPDPF